MIRINLLPTKAARRRETFIQQLLFGAIIFVLAIVVCFLDLRQQKGELKSLEAQSSKIKAEIKRLESVIREVESFKRDRQELLKKIGAIRKLQAQRSGPVKVMEEMTVIVPRKLWLSSFREANKAVKLEGASTDGVTIANFLDKLTKSKYFNNVRLIRVTQGSAKGAKVLNFIIECRVVYTA